MAKVQILITEEIGPAWWGEWGIACFSVNSLNNALTDISDKDEIEVLINSPGGVVDEGLAIFSRLIELGKTNKVVTRCIGQAASIAALIFLGGSERVMMPGTKAMIHQASSGEWGKADDLRKKADELEAESDNIFNLMIDRSDKMKENESKLREYFDSEKYIYADECVQLGIAHRVEELPKAYKFSNQKMLSTMFDMNKFKTTMQKLDKFLSGTKMASIQTDGDNATTIYYEGELKEGTAVFSDEAMQTALNDGDYVIGGSTYTVKDGKITSVSASSASADGTSTASADDAAAAAQAKAEQDMVASMKTFPNGEYTVNSKNYIVKDGVVSLKIETAPVVDVTKDPAFMQMQKDLQLMKTQQAEIEAKRKNLEKENSEMKAVIAEVKSIGFGQGLGDDVPAGYEMKDGKMVKKDQSKMSRKERLLMVAEQMESNREREAVNS